MAFVLAGFIALGTVGLAAVQLMASGMSDNVDMSRSGGGFLWTLGIGLPLAGIVAATHWLPHIGW